MSPVAIELDTQYDTLISLINDTFGIDSDRAQKLVKMYSDYEERIKTAPASGKLHFHNAFPGGYLDHILRVTETAKLMSRFYTKLGGYKDYTDEELVFSAIHHDLGKLGTLSDPYYVDQTSDWHIEKKNEVYKRNDDRQYMNVFDATIFILQSYGITVTQKEYLAIKLADGLYYPSNGDYLNGMSGGNYPMRTNLHHVIHWADHMATAIEKDATRPPETYI